MARAPAPSLRDLQRANARAVGFLRGRQRRWGEFETLASPEEDMARRCAYQSSPFATAQVLYSLRGLRGALVHDMVAKGLDFLESEMEDAGVWRFWSSRSAWHKLLPPDVDDTCCASLVLRMYQREVPQNRSLILANRNDGGLFFTWLVPRGGAARSVSSSRGQLDGLEAALALSRLGDADHVDCVVNANALLYLGESQETRGAVQHLIGVAVRGEEGDCSDFYPDPMALYYSMSRAYRRGVRAFHVVAPMVTDRVTRSQRADGSFGNELSTALAICAVHSFGGTSGAIHRAARFLLGAQADDGSWPCRSMFLGAGRYYGSKELTTGLCVEALAGCADLLSHQARPPASA